MNITNANQMSGGAPVTQSNQTVQDSHEKNIHNQIVSLQGKMRDLAYNTELSTDEKTDKKKKLQEQIQNLNSELKQYQIQKRREEAEKRQKETEEYEQDTKKASPDNKENTSSDTNTANTANTIDASKDVDGEKGSKNADSINSGGIPNQTDETTNGLSGAESEMIVSFSNTKKQFANTGKILTNLEGMMRTAETDEEKQKLQKRIDNVSNVMENRARKTADKMSEIRKDEESRKEKIRKMLKEQEERKSNIKAAIPKSGSTVSENNDGKVLITRKKS